VTARTLSWILAGAVLVYIVFAGVRAWALIATGQPALILFGVSVVIIPAIGVWVLWRELQFGRRTQQLGQLMSAERSLPEDDLPRSASGRIDTDAADIRFAEYEQAVRSSPEDWRRWYRLAIGYDDARDRKRARGAMRQAIALFDRGGA
jgi:ABC-type nickel/cobalt efflux system permease component RcnA